MKITAIEKQQKRKDRYSIFVDEKYEFSLSQIQVIDFGLKIGKEITTIELERFKKASSIGKYYDRILRYLSLRLRSKKEILDYLDRIGADQDQTEEIIKKLTKQNYLNDLEFAKMWVKNRRELKNASQRQIEFELKSKGIKNEIIIEAINDCSQTDLGAIRELIIKKRKTARYQDELKLKQYLARKGFNYETILKALDQD